MGHQTQPLRKNWPNSTSYGMASMLTAFQARTEQAPNWPAELLGDSIEVAAVAARLGGNINDDSKEPKLLDGGVLVAAQKLGMRIQHQRSGKEFKKASLRSAGAVIGEHNLQVKRDRFQKFRLCLSRLQYTDDLTTHSGFIGFISKLRCSRFSIIPTASRTEAPQHLKPSLKRKFRISAMRQFRQLIDHLFLASPNSTPTNEPPKIGTILVKSIVFGIYTVAGQAACFV
ncbi:hypothetical protein BDN72DRAFT_857836 [Pluteus cervinus]|uniref:Uncharacterized protein n=1 Tax=Pluteus cervinus TaxID=181527 RepID=A0ACD3AUF9_9AGAR|nr:hypothetical protein BDN72DRAFT_857836 [Pluteus cervinus]